MLYEAKSLEETQQIAGKIVSEIKPSQKAVVVGLYGDLGAGKTSFTQGVCAALGIKEQIVSPTFVIEKIYELEGKEFSHLIHVDAYRIESSDELLALGWNDIIKNNKNLIFVEWPEKVSDIMPEHIKIKFTNLNEQGRVIEVI